jgi:hypothetical protein
MRLHYDLVVHLRQAARDAREGDVVQKCKAFLRGEASDADRRVLADACWRLLGKEAFP